MKDRYDEANGSPNDVMDDNLKASGRNVAQRLTNSSEEDQPRDNSYYECANERLYEAYNELHLLAQDFEKPFDSPAILVVGHQTDGKSALVEALMGFQFNEVGGGTKTRRPITLHMKYNSTAVQPACYLMTEEHGEQEVTLEELQDYIRQENQRLEDEQQFWSKEIVVRIEYKYSPNLTIIDTPGLIAAAPGKRNQALQTAARQVEAMVQQKMSQQEYIILCLEDSSDWNNATTRRTVMQVDPTLSRTVLVSTKLDTRIPQFSTPSDVDAFLRAPGLTNDLQMLGSTPFFTSVPSGRVGAAREATFRTNDQYRDAVAQREMTDIQELQSKLQRKLDKQELSRLGVHQLRRFLEALLQRRYLDSVPAIVPLLEREHRIAESRLHASKKELENLATDKLKDKGRIFRESFLNKLSALLKGTVAAPSESFGETLIDEHLRAGAFCSLDGKPLVPVGVLPNCNMRLYGGAQFHRAMAEFRMGVGQMVCPEVSREEIVNACGVDDLHDGVNFVRTACVIAIAKSKEIFEPLIHQLGSRLAHVLRRILPISMYLLQKDGQQLSGHDRFLRRVGGTFNTFIEEVEASCKHRCLEDLTSTTRFVTWSLHTKSTKALRSMMSRLQLPEGLRIGSTGIADTSETVAALVCQVFEGIRDFIVQAVELKFNCFFLMPLVDTFPQHLREQLEDAFEDDVEGVFDVKAVRSALEARLKSLQAEKAQVEKLQSKFALIHSTLAQQAALQEAPAGAVKQSELAERMSLMSLTDSASLCSLGKLRLPSGRAAAGSATAVIDRDQVAVRDGKANAGAEGSAGGLGSKMRSGAAAGGMEAPGCVPRQTGPGSLAPMSAAGGPMSKMQQGARTLSQQVAALAGGKVGDAAANGIGHPDELEVPDLRFGYSADELTKLFETWGPEGRQWYLVTEAIDVFAYIPSYTLAFTVLLTLLGAVASRKTGLVVLRRAHLWPLILGVVDWVEDALQVLLVNSYVDKGQALPGWWAAVVPAASAVNQFKWWIVRAGVLFMVLLVAAAAAPRLRPTPPPKPAEKQQ
eukprot:gene3076-3355_t